jgi:serine/threonine-protein kinase
MGSVWRAEHLSWEAPVAIKLMNRDIADQPEARARFEREVRLAAGLRSPHVVQVLDHGVDEATRQPFIAMELLEGESLERRLKRFGRLSAAETFGIISQIVRALSRAHEAGIVHRDLKPENIFLVQNDEEHLAKVLDFGIAKGTHPLSLGLTRPGRILGTPYYMSPEQFRGSEIDQRSDLWSLSVIACECLTGRRPFEANDFGQLALLLLGGARRPLPSELGPVPAGFDAWFLRGTHAELARRFQSARELGHSLAAVCGVNPQRAAEDSAPKGLLPTETDGVSSGPLRWQESLVTGPAGWRPLVVRMVAASASALLIAALVVAFQLRQRSATATKPEATHAAQPATQALPLAPVTATLPVPPAPPAEPTPAPAPVDIPARPIAAPGLVAEEATPVDVAPAPSKRKSTRAHAMAKAPRPSRHAAPSAAAAASPESDPEVDINGRRIRMTLDPSP